MVRGMFAVTRAVLAKLGRLRGPVAPAVSEPVAPDLSAWVHARIHAWPHPGLAARIRGWAWFESGVRHANDAAAPMVDVAALEAADLACLTQAAVVLGLTHAAENLAIAAYRRLDGQFAPETQPAADAVWHALISARFSRLREQN